MSARARTGSWNALRRKSVDSASKVGKKLPSVILAKGSEHMTAVPAPVGAKRYVSQNVYDGVRVLPANKRDARLARVKRDLERESDKSATEKCES